MYVKIENNVNEIGMGINFIFSADITISQYLTIVMNEMRQLKITTDVVHKVTREGFIDENVLDQTPIEGLCQVKYYI